MGIRVTEKKTIKIDHECKNNPVFVSWLNTKGGREHWVFDNVHVDALITDIEADFEPNIDDLENSRGQIEILGMSAQPQLILNTLLDREDLLGVQTILYSPKIEVLQNADTWESDGILKWKQYWVEPGSFRLINNEEVRKELVITLNDNYINNVSQ